MGFLAPPIYILAVVVLACGGIPKGMRSQSIYAVQSLD
jgi:hypothetical protein